MNLKHDRWNAPKPEEIEEGEIYSFSYNPKAQPQLAPINHLDAFHGDNLKDFVKEEFVDLFKRLRNCEIDSRLEVSKNGRFHVHGTIKIKNIIKFYSTDLRRLQARGSYEIDTIEDMSEWNDYVIKQSLLMDIFCDMEGIPAVYTS